MLTDYLILGVHPDAGDEEIRKKYLELIKKHPPESDTERFQEVVDAYERIKDAPARLRTRILGPMETRETEAYLRKLFRAAAPKRQAAGFRELMNSRNEKNA